ncbi:MAG: hypothetical protein HYW70_00680 [Candidatus Nealsonbacteria bacterium]|nr:hypothetical protein [Candidatus Nealsonbacteria bacterium]
MTSEVRKNRFLMLSPPPQPPTDIHEIWQQEVVEYLWINKDRFVTWMELEEKILEEKIKEKPQKNELGKLLNFLENNGVVERDAVIYDVYRVAAYKIIYGTKISEYAYPEFDHLGEWIPGIIPLDRRQKINIKTKQSP